MKIAEDLTVNRMFQANQFRRFEYMVFSKVVFIIFVATFPMASFADEIKIPCWCKANEKHVWKKTGAYNRCSCIRPSGETVPLELSKAPRPDSRPIINSTGN